MLETQASRIVEQEEIIKELRAMVDELRSLKANLEESLEEFPRQFFGVRKQSENLKYWKVIWINTFLLKWGLFTAISSSIWNVNSRNYHSKSEKQKD